MQMDGLIDGDEQENPKVVMVLAATNHPWDIDDAFRRRFEKRVLIGLPSLIARKNLLDLNLKNVSLDDSVDLEEIAKLLDAYSGKESARIIILFPINFCKFLESKISLSSYI